MRWFQCSLDIFLTRSSVQGRGQRKSWLFSLYRLPTPDQRQLQAQALPWNVAEGMTNMPYKYRANAKHMSRWRHMRSPYENIARVSGDTCFMGTLGRKIRLWPHFTLDPGSDQVRLKNIKLMKPKVFFENIPVFLVFVLRFQECYLFYVHNWKCQKTCFPTVTASPLPAFSTIASADRSKIVRINFLSLPHV